jgi:hypothetical protein
MGHQVSFPCFVLLDGTRGGAGLPLLWRLPDDQGRWGYGLFVLASRLQAKEVIRGLKRHYQVHREGYHPARLGVRAIHSNGELVAVIAGTSPRPTLAIVEWTYDRARDVWRAKGGPLRVIHVPAGAGLN